MTADRQAAISAIGAFVDNYVESYVLDDDECYHEPTEHERFLIDDAINGLIADAEFSALMAASVVAERDALRAEVERLRVDAPRYRWLRDWLHAIGLLEHVNAAHRPDGTHGPATILRRPAVINGSELVGWSAGVGHGFDDAAIDAARAAQEGKT